MKFSNTIIMLTMSFKVILLLCHKKDVNNNNPSTKAVAVNTVLRYRGPKSIESS